MKVRLLWYLERRYVAEAEHCNLSLKAKKERTLTYMDGKSTQVPKYNIRSITAEDKSRVMELIYSFKEETESDEISDDSVRSLLDHIIECEDGVGLVLCEGSLIVGTILGAIQQHVYNPSLLILIELVWYVSPDKRKSLSNIKLLKHFEEEGRLKGANQSYVTLRENMKDVSKIYERLGYTKQESTFVRKL